MPHEPIIPAGGAAAALPFAGFPALKLGLIAVVVLFIGFVMLRYAMKSDQS